jgi:hypothetical protein
MKGNWINTIEEFKVVKFLIAKGVYARNPNSSIPFYYELPIADDGGGSGVPVWSRFAGEGRNLL